MPLTDLQVKGAKAKSKQYKLSDQAGVCLVVKPTGLKVFYLRYRYFGKEKMLSLGTYPQTSLAQAREFANSAKQLLKQNFDPSQVRKAEKYKHAKGETFAQIATAWFEETKVNKNWSQSYEDDTQGILDRYINPKIGKMFIVDVKTIDLLQPVESALSKKYFDTGDTIKQHLGAIMRFAKRKGLIKSNPADDLKDCIPQYVTQHRPALPFERLPEFFQRLDAYSEGCASKITILAIKTVLHSFIRSSELRLGRWNEIDFEHQRWCIPKERDPIEDVKYSYRGAKMDGYYTPLSKQVFEYLKEAKEISGNSILIFPSATKMYRPLSENTINDALRNMGYNTKTEVCCHGFRTMACSALNESGLWSKDAIERQMSHQERSSVRAAYIHKAEYLDERIKMMQWWSDYLDANRHQFISPYDFAVKTKKQAIPTLNFTATHAFTQQNISSLNITYSSSNHHL